jgi:hypothetical protein
MKKVLLTAVLAFIGATVADVNAGDICEELNLTPAPAIPSKEVLKKAAHIYMASALHGKCLYPEVTVDTIPVSEYEKFSPQGPNIVTLTARTVFRWGPYAYWQAAVNVPKGTVASAYTTESGQVIIEAVGLQKIYIKSRAFLSADSNLQAVLASA